jgi:hypothetical protein
MSSGQKKEPKAERSDLSEASDSKPKKKETKRKVF